PAWISPRSSSFPFMTPRPPTSPLFPYTTLFRSLLAECLRLGVGNRSAQRGDCRPPAIGSLCAREHRISLRERTDRLLRLIRCSRSEEHTSELQSLRHLVCRLLLEKKK